MSPRWANGPGRGERAVLWQQQPADAAADWAMVLGEILPPAMGPLPEAEHPRVRVMLTTGEAWVTRAEAARLADALTGWLLRTRWAAELNAPPGVDDGHVPGQLALPPGVGAPIHARDVRSTLSAHLRESARLLRLAGDAEAIEAAELVERAADRTWGDS